MSPFVLTLKLDAASFERLNALRQQHFPRERNILDAHLTLFHALAAERESGIRAALDEICARTAPMQLEFPGPRFLGKGTAIEVRAPAVEALRRELSERFGPFLSAQDARVIRPHITIQNKVTPTTARALFDELSARWQPFDGRGEGVALWRYQGGPWEAAGQWEFHRETGA